MGRRFVEARYSAFPMTIEMIPRKKVESMFFKRTMFLVAILTFIIVLIGGAVKTPPVAAQQPGVNLLTNGDFEAGAGQAWPFQDGIPEVQIAPGWRAFYVDNPPAKAKIPVSCGADVTHCSYWRRPEFRGVSAVEYSYRVHGGSLSQKYFTFAGQHEAGLYQQVGNIQPGTSLIFSVYMETWSCMPSHDKWNECPAGSGSNNPAPMHTKVGIDPYGGTDPWSPNIVWSPEINAYDQWTLFQVQAVAKASTVTVFTYSWADWTDNFFRLNNDVYIDDASLVVGSLPVTAPTLPPAVTAGPAPTSGPTVTPGPTATPRPTPTPRPDGAIVHVVQRGDTLGTLAVQYRVTVDQIVKLNNLTDPNQISVGQELVISIPAATPTPTPSPVTPMPTVLPPTATPAPGGLCVLVYHERSGDAARQAETEELVPNAVVSVVAADGTALPSYTTDGLKEPYCFSALPAGQYRVGVQPPPGYETGGPTEVTVVVGPGEPVPVALGIARTAVSTAVATPEATATPVASSGSTRTILLLAGGATLVVGVFVVGLLLRKR